ncbi:MAG TPA: DUF2218 domain-containing protein, partial [Novosphingobium sp.]|nr:DUF2218 domain-containing protein [Novosphingobium sp.]
MSAPIVRRSQARVATTHAPRMIAELAAYWEGKFPIAVEANGIVITFPSGEVGLHAQADALLAQVASQ